MPFVKQDTRVKYGKPIDMSGFRALIQAMGQTSEPTANQLFKYREVTPEDKAKSIFQFRAAKGASEKAMRNTGNMSPDVAELYNLVLQDYYKAGEQHPEGNWRENPKSGFNRIMDVLSRSTYVMANIADEYKKGNFNPKDVWREAGKGLTGKDKTTFGDVFNNKALGFLGDVFLDPTTYLSLGTVGVGKGVGVGIGKGLAKKVAGGKGLISNVSGKVALSQPEIDVLKTVQHVAPGTADNIGARALSRPALEQAVEQAGYRTSAKGAHRQLINERLTDRHMVDVGMKLGGLDQSVKGLNQYAHGVAIPLRKQINTAMSSHVGYFKNLFHTNNQIRDSLTGALGPYSKLSSGDSVFKAMLKDMYDVKMLGSKVDPKILNRLNEAKAALSHVAPNDLAQIEKHLDDAHGKLFGPANEDLFQQAGKSFRETHKDFNLSMFDEDKLKGLAGAKDPTDLHKFIEGGNKGELNDLLDQAGRADHTVKQGLDDVLDTNNLIGGVMDDFVKGTKEAGTRAIGIKTPFGGIPLKMLNNPDQFKLARMGRGVPAIARGTRAMDEYLTGLRATDSGIGTMRDIAHSDIDNLQTVWNRTLRNAFKGSNWKADKAAKAAFLETGKNPNNLMHDLLERVVNHEQRQGLPNVGGPSPTNMVSKNPNAALISGVRGIAKTLPSHLRPTEEALTKFEKRINNYQPGSTNKKIDNDAAIKQEYIDAFRELIKDAPMATKHRTLSSLMGTIGSAAVKHMHEETLHSGVKALGQTRKVSDDWRQIAEAELGKQGGVKLRQLSKQGTPLFFHKDDIEGIIKHMGMYKNPDEMDGLFKHISGMQRYWKSLVTVYNMPMYYLRNSLSDVVINSVNGVGGKSYVQGWQAISTVRKILKDENFLKNADNTLSFKENLEKYADPALNKTVINKSGKEIKLFDMIDGYFKHGLGSTQSMSDIIQTSGKSSSITGTHNKIHSKITNFANDRDNLFRFANFMHSTTRSLRDAGKKHANVADAMGEGADAVRKYNFDFSDFTPWERKTAANVVPFYRYYKRAMTNSVKIMAQSPGKFRDTVAFNEMFNNGVVDPVLPEYLQSGRFVPMSSFAGDTMYGSVPNPLTDVFREFEGQENSTTQNLGANLLGMLSPAISAPVSAAMHRDIASGYETTPAKVGSGLFGPLAQFGLPGSSRRKELDYQYAKNAAGYNPREPEGGIQALQGMDPTLVKLLFPMYPTYNTAKKQRSELERQKSKARDLYKSPTNPNAPRESKGETIKSQYSWNEV